MTHDLPAIVRQTSWRILGSATLIWQDHDGHWRLRWMNGDERSIAYAAGFETGDAFATRSEAIAVMSQVLGLSGKIVAWDCRYWLPQYGATVRRDHHDPSLWLVRDRFPALYSQRYDTRGQAIMAVTHAAAALASS